ncbi:MAG: segregation and condensation protein A [Candidatus Kapaibacterium sp.]
MYKIKLPNFEGPFDLLLYFIRRDELNIYDIPIAKVTEEFLNYIRLMKYFDLELAGEFILMASTLMYIKTRMLLPRNDPKENEDAEDPRTELVERLLEYKQYKEVTPLMAEMADEQRYTMYRNIFEADMKTAEKGMNYRNASLFDLMKAFKTAIDRTENQQKEHIVQLLPVSVEEKSKHILSMLAKKTRIGFFEIIKKANRPNIIATFLALLDLIKNRRVFIEQDDSFSDIYISPGADLANVN